MVMSVDVAERKTTVDEGKKTELWHRFYLWLGTLYFLLGSAALIVFGPRLEIMSAIFIMMGGITYAMGYVPYIGGLDERGRRIGNKAATIAWIFTMSFAGALLSVRTALAGLAVIAIDGYQILGLILTIMVVSMLAANWYYLKKGDVE
ncbi:MAG TPA: hypothetical protein VK436_02690 [Methanocella sp.]|nr:hypothetical protein [Methanocella sp.]